MADRTSTYNLEKYRLLAPILQRSVGLWKVNIVVGSRCDNQLLQSRNARVVSRLVRIETTICIIDSKVDFQAEPRRIGQSVVVDTQRQIHR